MAGFGWQFGLEALELVSWRSFRIRAELRTHKLRAKDCRYCPGPVDEQMIGQNLPPVQKEHRGPVLSNSRAFGPGQNRQS
jgi:hypothetical protein